MQENSTVKSHPYLIEGKCFSGMRYLDQTEIKSHKTVTKGEKVKKKKLKYLFQTKT